MGNEFRPYLETINVWTVENIIEEALDILKKIGIFVENQEAVSLLMEKGAEIKENRIFIDEDLIWDCISKITSPVKIYNRPGNLVMNLTGGNVYFVPGSTALYFRDSQGSIRKPDTYDYVNLVKLTDSLPNIAAQSTAMIPNDVPAEIADRYRLYLSLLYSQKPVVTGTFIKESFALMKEMLVAVRGSEENLRQKPLAIFDACPSPPLKWSDLTCQALIDCARSSIPAELVSMPLAGATAPVTLYGSLVQHTAENLSGIVIHQLAQPGAPIIYGGSPEIFDMRFATAPLGAIETLMVGCAYAQIGEYLDLPTHGYMGISDAKDLDSQLGIETGIGATLAALSGVNVIAGAGMLGSENCQSLEKLMIDNDVCGMALRLVKGIESKNAPKTEQIMRDCAASGNFLEHPTTLQLFKKEQFIPGLFTDRTDIDVWLSQKKKNLKIRLKEAVEKTLQSHSPVPLDKNIEKELRKIWMASKS